MYDLAWNWIMGQKMDFSVIIGKIWKIFEDENYNHLINIVLILTFCFY